MVNLAYMLTGLMSRAYSRHTYGFADSDGFSREAAFSLEARGEESYSSLFVPHKDDILMLIYLPG